MGLLERLMHGPTVRAWQKDAENVRAFLAALGPRERTQSRVNTLAALAFISQDVKGTEHEEAVDNAFQAMFHPELRLSREDSGHVSLFLIRQMKNQREWHASPDLVNQVIAAGIPVWIMSFRAVQKTELIAQSRAIWAFLDDVDHVEVQAILVSMSQHFNGHHIGDLLDVLRQFQTPKLFRAL